MKPLLFILVCTVFWSCEKAETPTVVAEHHTGASVRIRAINFVSSTIGFAVGGNVNEQGIIFRTIDGGSSWTQQVMEDESPVYCIHFVNDSVGYAGGDFNTLYKTTDAGLTWKKRYFRGFELAYHEFNRNAIREIKFFDENNGYYVGGDNYNKGTIYRTVDAGANWTFDTLAHEMNTLAVNENNEVVYGGFGVFLSEEYSEPTTAGDFITGMDAIGGSSFIGVSQHGGIYLSNNNGESWERSFQDSDLSYNDVTFDLGKIFAVGNYGVISVSSDNGSSWKQFELAAGSHLHSVTVNENDLFCTSDQGIIYQLAVDQF